MNNDTKLSTNEAVFIEPIEPPRPCAFRGRSNQAYFCPGWAIASIDLPSDDCDKLFLIKDLIGTTCWVNDWAICWEGYEVERLAEYFEPEWKQSCVADLEDF